MIKWQLDVHGGTKRRRDKANASSCKKSFLPPLTATCTANRNPHNCLVYFCFILHLLSSATHSFQPTIRFLVRVRVRRKSFTLYFSFSRLQFLKAIHGLLLRNKRNDLIVDNIPRDPRHHSVLASISIVNHIQRGQREINPAAAHTRRTTIKDKERATGNGIAVLENLDLLSTIGCAACLGCQECVINGHHVVCTVLLDRLPKVGVVRCAGGISVIFRIARDAVAGTAGDIVVERATPRSAVQRSSATAATAAARAGHTNVRVEAPIQRCALELAIV